MILRTITVKIFYMPISNVEQALITQNPHWQGVAYDQPIKRLHDDLVLRDIDLDEILIITGIRRCGKSTLMHALINHLTQKFNPREILYINLDDPLYTPICQDASLLYEVITQAEKLTSHKIQFLFLDEIQNVQAWEKYVKSVYDSKLLKKIVVTGSNAELLQSDYANLLTGRYLETHVYPLSFKELLHYRHITDNLSLIQNKPKVLEALDDYLKFGGFPRIQLIQDNEHRIRLLKNYYETIVLKDCIQNHQIRDTKSFMNFSYYILNNLAAAYSYNSLGRGLSIHENTAAQYIHILENAYFIDELQTFSYSIKTQNKSKKKSYCIDNGLITAVSFQFSQNLGKLFENLVFSELTKQNTGELFMYYDKKECDFIVHQKSNLAIQACYEITLENRAREIEGLEEAMNTFGIKKGIIITYNQEDTLGDNIFAIPFWKYFFN